MMRYINNRKATLLFVVLVFFFQSCATYRAKKRIRIYQNVVKWAIEYNYRNSHKGKHWPPRVMVHPEMDIEKFYPLLNAFNDSAVLRRAGCDCFDKGLIENTVVLSELPPINTHFEVSLRKVDKINWRRQKGDYYIFSPLVKTQRKNIFCLVIQMNNYESIELFFYLIKKKGNNKFEYYKTLDGVIAHY